jgi:16S rRNA (adenine1518-N6/adenine1519-N6)-dimethyltransferase
LVENGAQVLAIEKDRRLAHFLNRRFGADRKLTLVHADALDYLRRQPHDWSGWKLVSNLPYSVASAILVELARLRQPPDRIVVTVQLEVAQRLMAPVATEEYGILTLLVQLTYKPDALFRIPPSCFFPAPKVDSACVTLVRRTTPLLQQDHRSIFDKVIKRGFSQRRKMMFKLLRTDWPAEVLDTAFGQIGLDPQVRAEKVSLDQFVHLALLLKATDNLSQAYE